LIALEVVFSGEHYVVDLAGALAVAGAIALAARIDFRRAFRGLPAGDGGAREDPSGDGQRSLSPDTPGAAVPVGLTSRPGAIFIVTAALILVVSVKVALAL
jgi:hypothetical protein